ncbi:hypothetical protein BWQ96_00625 [Gracilariopsis chorda]|uniref:Uncharacterized protein n=1 Tax=Gracilariopsis chorda TaxID=448386 RepID=A0A2V3J573_9FLOR|nr:hypothetical protein BWQ96_00625 [Gracilariopsis chorda]|eukprot:PXF49555.1 hypothetical protein BWQ96_00625 [Gracilariopsis chorda]
MFQQENKVAARQIVESLRKTLNSCTADLGRLRNSLDQNPTGTPNDAREFVKNTAHEVEKLRRDVAPLCAIMRNTPRAQELMNAAYKQINSVEDIFHRFEEHAQEKYGIEPLRLPGKPGADVCESIHIPSTQVSHIDGFSSMMKHGCAISSLSHSRTPVTKQAVSHADGAIPATPRLEDFGLRDEDIRALTTKGTGAQNKENFSSTDIPENYSMSVARNAGVKIDEDENYETMVLNSMSALGIETPDQLAQRFATRRNVALKEVLQTTTPRVKAGSQERTLDYTGLAHGYFESTRKNPSNRLHRTLNFGETPVVKSRSRDAIIELYEELDDFWKSTFSLETVQEVCYALGASESREFSKAELLDILGKHVPVQRSETLVAVLSKMKALRIHKVHGNDAVYSLSLCSHPEL